MSFNVTFKKFIASVGLVCFGCCSAGALGLPLPAQAESLNAAAIQKMHAQLQKGEQARSYSFVVTGDNREGDGIFEQILQQAAYYRPRFMLHTGDFVASGQYRQYLGFMRYVQRAAFPVITALGNHDIIAQGRKWYQRYFGLSYFAFTYGPDRFMVLDNANGSLSDGQLHWLEGELKKPARYRFIAMHMPPQNIIWFHAFDQGARKLMTLASKYHVNYVFAGHIHVYDRMEYQGVVYIVSGSAGAPMYRMPLYIDPEGGAFYHFVLMQVSDAGIKEQIVHLKP